MQELKPGDVVQLKSGGPIMTIENIGQYGYEPEQQAQCKWFEGAKLLTDTFRLTSLEIVEE